MLCSFSATAQTLRNCATHEYNQQQNADNATIRRNRQAIEIFTEEYKKLRSATPVVTIPVVVHVVYAESEQNISTAQIESQIRILNEDFRRLNADAVNTPMVFDPVAADIEIEFCLATIDPLGNPTDGITRTATDVPAFSFSDDDVKSSASGGKDPWPADQYMNFWVCSLDGGTLGYAQFPGGSPTTDGIVVDYQYVGDIGTATAPFDKGRTATHEVGHYLNLRHIWGDGACTFDDLVEDTPAAGEPNYTGLPCDFPGPNTCDTGLGDPPDMFMNYMDYSLDACFNMFTLGQKDRMRAVLTSGGARYGLTTSPAGCTSGSCIVGPLELELQLDDFPNEISWSVTSNIDGIVAAGGPYDPEADVNRLIQQTIPLTPGIYAFQINDSFGDGLCCDHGNGYVQLRDGNGQIIFMADDFSDLASFSFCIEKASCPATLLLDETPIPAGSYTAANAIEASATVASGSNVSLESASITLTPGFTVEAGAVFSAMVSDNPCSVHTSTASSGSTSDSYRAMELPGKSTRQEQELLVYPNPTSGQIQATWHTGQEGDYMLRVITPLGQIVHEWESPQFFHPGEQHNATIDLSRHGPGLYLLTLQGPSTRITRSVVVH